MNNSLPSFYFRHKAAIQLFGIILFFSQKITAATYYVNDSSTKGDIYTKAPGNDKNDGLSPDTPKIDVLSVYIDAKKGDTIYIDKGTYKDISSTGRLLFDNKKDILFIIAGTSDKAISKKPLPSEEKINPAEFYILEDKPVSREVYMQRLHSTAQKNKG